MLRRRQARSNERTTGPPTSSNGASSMHLWWTPAASPNPLERVSAVLTIVEPPSVERLHFWALQATFVDPQGRPVGGAHLGLQWHAGHPGGTAVNWGGYRSGGPGGELDAHAPSELPSATGNVNTRDFAWAAHTPYRLTIAADGTGSMSDLDTGRTTVVRRLDVRPAVGLASPVVWSEVFARCDDPSSAVRWSDLDPPAVTTQVTYQSFEDGGCTNTRIDVVAGGFVQRTNVGRRLT